MNMNWLRINTFFYFLVIFSIFASPLENFGVYSYTFSHNETEPGYQTSQILNYQDGTVVVFLTKAINETCNESRINLRIINPVGAVNKVEVDHSIPDFNFCIKPNDSSLHIALFSKRDYIIILYENSTDVNLASFYALIVNAYTGNVISDTFLSRVSIIDGVLSHSGNVYPHINDAFGFLFRSFVTKTKMNLTYFSNPNLDGSLELININEIELYHSESNFNIFATVDGGFGFVTIEYTVHSKPYYDIDNELDFAVTFYVSFIKPQKNLPVDGPRQFYGTEIHSTVAESVCNIGYTTLGNTCIFNIKRPQLIGEPNNYLLHVNFLSSSILSNVTLLQESYDFKKIINLSNLYYGGYLILNSRNSNNNLYETVQAIVLDNNGTYNSNLLPEDFRVPNNPVVTFFQNNTLAISQQDNRYAWNFYVTDEYPRFIHYDNGCDTPFVKSVYPLVGSNIPLSLGKINITYEMPITRSKNNVSIYQYNNGDSVLRQSSKFYSIDDKTLTLDVLESTFSQPNADYYITIDDDTVQDTASDEALIGIKKNLWKFKTVDNQYNVAEKATGILTLNFEGTKDYDDLSRHNKEEFRKQLRVDLAKLIPIEIDRLGDIGFYQYDKSEELPKISLELPIKPSIDKHDPDVDQIIKTLDMLIQRKNITSISRFDSTKNLDNTLGFKKKRNFLSDFKVYLISIAAGTVIPMLFYFCARIRAPRRDNFVLVKNPLIIMDFVLDLLFLINNGGKLKDLHAPSVALFAAPITLNFMMVIVTILKEIMANRAFFIWCKSHYIVLILSGIISITDLEMTSTIFSQVLNIKYFYAPISEKMRFNIFCAGIFGLIIEDIPQFVVQVYYFETYPAFQYDIISFLSLLTSFLVLVSNILSRVYYLYKKKRSSKISFEPPQESTVEQVEQGRPAYRSSTPYNL